MNFTWIKYYIIILIISVYNFSVSAQNDVALSIYSNISVTEIGEEFTFNITIENVKETDVEGLKIQINVPSSLDYIAEEIPIGTVFTAVSGEWNIYNQLSSSTDSLSLQLTFSPNTEGTHFMTAEVIEMIGFDFNSNAQNGDFLEDDFGIGCIAVPIQMGQNDTVCLVAPIQFGETHQWYKKINLGDELVTTGAFFSATTPGIYSYKNTINACEAGTCCDIILVDRPEPCSLNAYANAICKNNSTLSDGSDDIFVLDIKAVAEGSGYSDNYVVLYNGTPLNIGGTSYGENIIVSHPDFTSNGASTFSLIIQDADDADCQQVLEINAPEECSTSYCDLYAKIQENNCCQECRTGNLELKLAHWRESYKEANSINVARSKPTNFNRSPFDIRRNAHNSTDGLYSGEPFGGFDYAFSKGGDYNYWDIDLVGFYDIEEFRIFTKEDCCGGDANSYRVFVSNELFNTLNYNQLLIEPGVTNFSVSLTNNSDPSIISNINTLGRFARIYLEGSGQMQLIEVEIIGSGNENSSPYSYTWNDIEIDNIPNPKCLPADVYTVTVMDITTGCTVTKNIIVE